MIRVVVLDMGREHNFEEVVSDKEIYTRRMLTQTCTGIMQPIQLA